MSAIYGIDLVCAGVFLVAYLAHAKQASIPAKWTKSVVLVSSILFVLLVEMVFGTALTVQAFLTMSYDEFGVLEFLFACALVATTVMACRELRRPKVPTTDVT
jgi:hypothetical protein